MMKKSEIYNMVTNSFRRFERSLKFYLVGQKFPRDLTPDLEFGEDNASYTNKDKIHIGVRTPVYDVVYDPKEAVVGTQYLILHEAQHCLSTTDKWWLYGIEKGTEEIIRAISVKLEGPGARRLETPTDFSYFLKEAADKHNLFIKVAQIEKICHFIQNSIEDGRIERICSSNHVGFKNSMILIRSRVWSESVLEVKTPEKLMNPSEKMMVIMNQILSLATNGLYQKGYLKTYHDSDMTRMLDNEILPLIQKGVESVDCRGAMLASIEIEKVISNLIIDVCTGDAAALEEILKVLQHMMEEQLKPFTPSDQERKGNPEDAEPSEGSDSQIVIKKGKSSKEESQDNKDGSEASGKSKEFEMDSEDPSQSEETDHEKDASGGTDGTDGADEYQDTEESASNSFNSPEDSKEESNSNNESEPEKDAPQSDGIGAGKESSEKKESEGKDSSESSGDCENLTDADAEEMSESMSKAPLKSGLAGALNPGRQNQSTTSERISESLNSIKEQIKEAMERAAKEALGDAQVETIAQAPKEEKMEEAPDSEPLSKELGMPSMYPASMRFDEIPRCYKMTYELPVEIEGTAKKLEREIKNFFKNKKDPVYRNHRSGRLDARSIHKLSMQQTDVFARKGIADKFSGAASILIDNSGSMGYGRGSKRQYALEASAVIEYAFKNIMPLKITAFDAHGDDYVTHERIKGFDEKTSKSASYNFYRSGRDGNGNKDGYSIRVASKELLSRPEKERILIVCSDGCPSCYSGGRADGISDVRSAVRDARNKGIKVVGIYFSRNPEGERDAYAQMYEKDYVCTTPDKIADELTKVFKRFTFK